MDCSVQIEAPLKQSACQAGCGRSRCEISGQTKTRTSWSGPCAECYAEEILRWKLAKRSSWRPIGERSISGFSNRRSESPRCLLLRSCEPVMQDSSDVAE